MNRPLTYLAVPYSHPDRAVRLARFEAANVAVGKLMKQGVLVFSPISHAHSIAEAGGLPLGFDYWERYDRAVLSCCHRMIVLMIDGWKESVGVRKEIAIATEMGIPVKYVCGCGVCDVCAKGDDDV